MRWLKTPPNPEHWSKDYVEHLRTVHFALVTVSVGLIVILASKPYDVQKARTQIEELLEIKGWWSGDELEAHFPVHRDFHFPSSPKEVFKSLTNPGKLPLFAEASGDSGVTLKFPPDGWYWCENERNLSARTFPNSIRDLRVWWEKLGSGYSLLRVTEISEQVFKDSLVPEESRVLLFKAVEAPHRGNEVVFVTLAHSWSAENVILIAYSGTDLHKLKGLYREAITVDQTVVFNRFQDLPPGTFDDTFKDLIRAARSSEDLDLQSLEHRISEQAAKGSEVFEMFGLKLPAEQLSTQGLIVLLCVQLYLSLYLKRLSNKLQPDDPGWDTPWIAMDQSWIAQLCVFITFIVLPVTAALAASQAFGVNTKDWHVWWKQKREITVAFELATSLVLGICSWIYRPRMKEPKMPPWMYP